MEYADYKVRCIPTREKAEAILNDLRATADLYGIATLADLKDLCEIKADFIDSKTMWLRGDLKSAKIFRARYEWEGGYEWEIDLSSCHRFIDRSYSKKSEKENNMNINDVKVIIGNKAYRAQTANFTQTVGDYPQIELEASLAPYNRIPTSSVRPTNPLTITNVIFNSPATIVFWSDNTKTVVKADLNQEEYDPEKGLAMAIAKKTFGDNKYEYYNTFLHWLKKYNKRLNNHE